MNTLMADRYKFENGRHIHTLNDQPLCGTSTIVSILDKPGLQWWSSGLACAKFGRLDPKKNSKADCLKSAEESLARIKGMSLVDYQALLSEAYKAHNERKKEAAGTGVNMHSSLETYIKGCMVKDFNGTNIGFFVGHELIKPFMDWSEKNVKRFLFSELYCYSQSLWVGGIADFGYEDMEGNYVLGDFKSSEAAYFGHWLQMGGYDLQITENGGFTESGEKV